MFKLEDSGDGIWINEMKKGVDVKYENDGRILWLSSCPPAVVNVDDVPLGQILETKATHFCSQTVNMFCSLFNKLNYFMGNFDVKIIECVLLFFGFGLLLLDDMHVIVMIWVT
ncbi:hypothetical protein VPH35_092756 [Triticum aestivum]